MRLVFAGTPEFAATILVALIARGHDIRLVLTQPDRPAGRGLRESISAVKRVALEADLRVEQPASLKESRQPTALAEQPVDAWIVAAYGLILPKRILDAPPFGCINVHASLLPRWRGAAPIQRAIMAGDRETGISIMHMDEGLDTGPVYARRAIPIEPSDTAGRLHDKLARLGAEALCDVLAALPDHSLTPLTQPTQGACYAPKLTRADSLIDWSLPATQLERQIRALAPVPGAATEFAGQALKIWGATLPERPVRAAPGEVQIGADGLMQVGCGEGSLVITELQRAGGRRMSAADFTRGAKIAAGTRFGQ